MDMINVKLSKKQVDYLVKLIKRKSINITRNLKIAELQKNEGFEVCSPTLFPGSIDLVYLLKGSVDINKYIKSCEDTLNYNKYLLGSLKQALEKVSNT